MRPLLALCALLALLTLLPAARASAQDGERPLFTPLAGDDRAAVSQRLAALGYVLVEDPAPPMPLLNEDPAPEPWPGDRAFETWWAESFAPALKARQACVENLRQSRGADFDILDFWQDRYAAVAFARPAAPRRLLVTFSAMSGEALTIYWAGWGNRDDALAELQALTGVQATCPGRGREECGADLGAAHAWVEAWEGGVVAAVFYLDAWRRFEQDLLEACRDD